MRNTPAYASALQELSSLLKGLVPGDKTYDEIVAPRDEVLMRYGKIFSPEHVGELTVHEYRSFLYIKNNHHWSGLYRTGLAAKDDMAGLRRALALLLDETRSVASRLNQVLGMVPGFGKAIATPILLVVHPTKYGVWNDTSERGLKQLGLWPELAE